MYDGATTAQRAGVPSAADTGEGFRDEVSLHTDHYELTMLAAALDSGIADKPAVFEVFARALPKGRRYGVVAGLGRLLDLIEQFRFDARTVEYLLDRGVVGRKAAEWLRAWEPTATIHAYREGELYTAGSPVLQVFAPFAEGLLLETLALSVLNHDTAVASAAARMRSAAGDRSLLDMGSRRVHESAAVAAARAAVIGGVDATSNLAAGRRWEVPTAGTAAHAFTLAHTSELDAFRTQLRQQGVRTTLLVDTYDTRVGVDRAVQAARELGVNGPGAVRVDSGDLRTLVPEVRRQLDALGAEETEIVVSGDVDEYAIAELADVPVDRFGVGTRLATGSGAPTAQYVFKLVAIGEPLRAVSKESDGKGTRGGVKRAWRLYDRRSGLATGELVVDRSCAPPSVPRRELQSCVMSNGVRRGRESVSAASGRRAYRVGELPDVAKDLSAGPPALPTWTSVEDLERAQGRHSPTTTRSP